MCIRDRTHRERDRETEILYRKIYTWSIRTSTQKHSVREADKQSGRDTERYKQRLRQADRGRDGTA